ncbi:AAA family ATPase [Candidatus Woesearchaeota archaeon]|jgi:dephospho-CoA kinase|nr:AAA family ATPase [Candidatus Woesearchaeota archaeon]
MIIAVTGPISSGKGKVAEFFRDKGFVHHSFSAEIRQVAKERGIEVSRETLSKLGHDLRIESPDKSILGQKLLDKIEKEVAKGKKRFVLEGLRDADEVDLFRKHELEKPEMRFILIGVDAPQELRFERMKSRRRHGEPQTFAEFKEIDDKEWKGGYGQEVGKIMKMADYIIQNDSALDDLQKKVEEIAKEILG